MEDLIRERYVQLRRVVKDSSEGLLRMNVFTKFTECGTAHCAAGWAATDPWFNEQGLKTCNNTVTFLRGTALFSGPAAVRICFSDLTISWQDVDKLFALNDFCISRSVEVSKEQVIENIDRILAGQPPIPYISSPKLTTPAPPSTPSTGPT